MRVPVLLLITGVVLGGDVEERLARLERRIDDLDRRLGKIENLLKLAMKRGQYEASKTEDLNGVRNIVGLLTTGGDVPFDKQGRVDVSRLVRNGDIEQRHLKFLHSKRFGYGPSWEKAKRGDYSRFPYERLRKVAGVRIPLLWDRQPDEKGGRVVGFSSGAVKWYPEERIQEMLKRFKQLPNNPPR